MWCSSPHIMNGDEYDKLAAQTELFREKFVRLAIGRPLLTTVQDYKRHGAGALQVLPTREKDTALVFMGARNEHFTNPAYCQLEYVFHDLGRTDAYRHGRGDIPGWKRYCIGWTSVRGESKCALSADGGGGRSRQNDFGGDERTLEKPDCGAGRTVRAFRIGRVDPGIREVFVRHAEEAE